MSDRSSRGGFLPQPILGADGRVVRKAERPATQPLTQPATAAPSQDAVSGDMKFREHGMVATPVLSTKRAKSALEAGLTADRALVSGMGGLRFRALSPPGSGRLVRIPFYPINPAQAWTGGNGVETVGDDPVCNIVISAGQTRSERYTMLTYQFDYGAYKLVGLQTNFQGSYNTGETLPCNGPVVPPGSSPQGVAISVGNLSLYNGQTLFLQLEDMDAQTFAVLPDYEAFYLTSGGAVGSQRENPYNYLARRSRFFPGLRDYPVVFGTANITLEVSAFIGNSTLLDVEIPFTCYAVAELVEDYVFGDIVNPSPAGRAGANVKLGAKDMGVSIVGRRQFDLTSARYTNKVRRSGDDNTGTGGR